MEGLTSFLQIGAFVVAMLTLYKGLSEYGKNNLFKRAEVLENLIRKFKDDKLYIAKRLLDDFEQYYYPGITVSKLDEEDATTLTKPITFVHGSYEFSNCTFKRIRPKTDTSPLDKVASLIKKKVAIGKSTFSIEIDGNSKPPATPSEGSLLEYAAEHYPGVDLFKFIKLSRILRNHQEDIIDENEVFFRDSFDELLDFVLLLTYYLRNEIITMREVNAHFQYYLLSMKNNVDLVNYIKVYYNWSDFEWLFKQLPRN